MRIKFLGRDWLFCFISKCSKTLLQQLLGNTEIWQQHKQLNTMEMRERLDLIFTMRDININSNLNPLTKFTSSSRSTEFKDIVLWNISQMITKTVPISTTAVMSYVMKQGIPFWVWQKIKGNCDNNMIWNSQWRESHCRTNISARKKKSKAAGPWESVRDPSRKNNHQSKVICNRKS